MFSANNNIIVINAQASFRIHKFCVGEKLYVRMYPAVSHVTCSNSEEIISNLFDDEKVDAVQDRNNSVYLLTRVFQAKFLRQKSLLKTATFNLSFRQRKMRTLPMLLDV